METHKLIGINDVREQVKARYGEAALRVLICQSGEEGWAPQAIKAQSDADRAALDGKVMGAFIRGTKPS